MKRLAGIIFVAVALMLPPASLRAEELVWAGQAGGPEDDEALGVAVGASGNIYAVGSFEGTADFDPGPGTHTLTSVSSGSPDAYVVAMDGLGGLLWARQFGGSASVVGEDVAVDANDNVYTVGFFLGTVDFDPGPGTFNLTAVGGTWNTYVCVLDSGGNFVWARHLAGYLLARGIAIDSSGNVVTVGSLLGSADFDPGPGTFTLNASGSRDAFISVLDGAGNFVRAVQLGGSESDNAHGVAAHEGGNIYVVGNFRGTVDFDPRPGPFFERFLTSAGGSDAFVSVFNSLGNYVWAARLGGVSNASGLRVAVDVDANVYSAGYFGGTADFDPGTGTFDLSSAGSNDVFVSALDSSGGFRWAARLGGNASDACNGLALDPVGNVYTVGNFRETADFDPGVATFGLTSAGSYDAFVSVLDSSGRFVWAGQLSGSEAVGSGDVAVGARGDIYTVGAFLGTADLDPGPDRSSMNTAGLADVFVVALSPCGGFIDRSAYGTLLFRPRCTLDASTLPQDAYDATSRALFKRANDLLYLSANGSRFDPLVVDDLVYCDGQDTGLGPYGYRTGVPPFILDAPVEYNLVPEPVHDITTVLPTGPTEVLFELLDTDRAIHGNTSVYLVLDCGIWFDRDGAGLTRLNWVSHAVDVVGVQSDLDVVSGLLSELRLDGSFSRACELGAFVDTIHGVDSRPDPPAGDGYYYLVNGTCATAVGYGESSAGPRQGLPPGSTCP
jgi:hypothetical protein